MWTSCAKAFNRCEKCRNLQIYKNRAAERFNTWVSKMTARDSDPQPEENNESDVKIDIPAEPATQLRCRVSSIPKTKLENVIIIKPELVKKPEIEYFKDMKTPTRVNNLVIDVDLEPAEDIIVDSSPMGAPIPLKRETIQDYVFYSEDSTDSEYDFVDIPHKLV